MLKVMVQDTRNGGEESLIANQVIYADTPALRRKGLLGRPVLDPNEGVLLAMPPRLSLSLFHSIHMFGVPFELAVAWLDEEGTILDVKRARSERIYFPSGFLRCTPFGITRTRYILEVHPEHLPLLQEGHCVRWREAGDE